MWSVKCNGTGKSVEVALGEQGGRKILKEGFNLITLHGRH